MQYCTYIHARPSGEPFYAGKGGLGRANNLSGGRNIFYQRTVAKYGRENIIITILPMETEEDAFEVEKYLIEEYRKAGFHLCNHTNGGEGFAGGKHCPESRAKISAANKLNIQYSNNTGSPITATTESYLIVAVRL